MSKNFDKKKKVEKVEKKPEHKRGKAKRSLLDDEEDALYSDDEDEW